MSIFDLILQKKNEDSYQLKRQKEIDEIENILLENKEYFIDIFKLYPLGLYLKFIHELFFFTYNNYFKKFEYAKIDEKGKYFEITFWELKSFKKFLLKEIKFKNNLNKSQLYYMLTQIKNKEIEIEKDKKYIEEQLFLIESKLSEIYDKLNEDGISFWEIVLPIKIYDGNVEEFSFWKSTYYYFEWRPSSSGSNRLDLLYSPIGCQVRYNAQKRRERNYIIDIIYENGNFKNTIKELKNYFKIND